MGLIGFRPKRQRLGKFAVHVDGVRIDPVGMRALLRDVIVTWCQLDPQSEELRYIGLHPDFDEIEEGAPVPTYEPEVSICAPCHEAGDHRCPTHQTTWTRLDKQQHPSEPLSTRRLRNVLDGDA